MRKKFKVTSIKIKTPAGKEFDLTIKEAKVLYQELDAMFGKTYLPYYPLTVARKRLWCEPVWATWNSETK